MHATGKIGIPQLSCVLSKSKYDLGYIEDVPEQ